MCFEDMQRIFYTKTGFEFITEVCCTLAFHRYIATPLVSGSCKIWSSILCYQICLSIFEGSKCEVIFITASSRF